jgi:autotransporter-associated beta strand protein
MNISSSPNAFLKTTALLAIAALMLPGYLHGQNATWDAGGGGNRSINNPTNWEGDSAPDLALGTATLTFGTGGTRASLNIPINVAGIVINRPADFFFISGTGEQATVGSGGILASPSVTDTVIYAFDDPVILSANQAWTVQNTGAETTTLEVLGLEGDFNLTKNGTGILSILANGTRSNSNTATVNQGILELGDATALNTNANAQLLLNGGQLRLANDKNTTFAGTNITVSANSSITSTKASQSPGEIPVHTVGNISIGARTLTMSEGGVLQNTGLGIIQTGAVSLTGNAVFNVVNNSNAEALLKLGAVGQSGGTRTLTKTGNGTLEFTATNSFTGNTTVAAGTLLANSNSTSSAVNVQNSATIGGNGSVGTLALASGATLSPGNSPGTLTVAGDATWSGGANYNWQVASLNENPLNQVSKGINWDFFSVNGTLNLAGLDTAPLNFNLWSLASINPDTNGIVPGWATATGDSTWAIAEASGGIRLNGTPLLANTNYTSLFNINTAATNGAGGWLGTIPGGSGFQIVTLADVNTLYLFAPTPVPEPGQIAASLLLIGGLAGYLLLKRRRPKNPAPPPQP